MKGLTCSPEKHRAGPLPSGPCSGQSSQKAPAILTLAPNREDRRQFPTLSPHLTRLQGTLIRQAETSYIRKLDNTLYGDKQKSLCHSAGSVAVTQTLHTYYGTAGLHSQLFPLAPFSHYPLQSPHKMTKRSWLTIHRLCNGAGDQRAPGLRGPVHRTIFFSK